MSRAEYSARVPLEWQGHDITYLLFLYVQQPCAIQFKFILWQCEIKQAVASQYAQNKKPGKL